nr:MAG TPA: major capsid protein [Caudoviricetes sp.]
MSLRQERADALVKAKDLAAQMEANPTEESVKAATDAALEAQRLDTLLEKHRGASNLMASLKDNATAEMVVPGEAKGKSAATVGDHFVKANAEKLKKTTGEARWSITAPEFTKDVPDRLTGGPDGDLGYFLTEVDRTIVKGPRRDTVTSLFGRGTISGQAITYFVESDVLEGQYETIAEAGAYPKLYVGDPTPVTDPLSKIGGYIRMSDEMLTDLQFLVSEIDSRLMYELSLVEEGQVLYGDGAGTNLKGVLNRNGVQVNDGVPRADLADEIFKSMTRVSQATNLQPDALVVNPADYEGLRLAKDANAQYMGGGYFQGQYGVNGFAMQPPVWGLRTVVTTAVDPGTLVVGAFKQGATVYNKGGVAVEATNSNDDDFLNGLVTVRATKRLALAVRRPAAFVKLGLA